jgi:hypothetical protein
LIFHFTPAPSEAALLPTGGPNGQHIACAALGLLGGPGFIAFTLLEVRKQARLITWNQAPKSR